jgi:uncharacterized membrane protein (UPF0182 family)
VFPTFNFPSRPKPPSKGQAAPPLRRGPLVWTVLALAALALLLVGASRVWTEILWFEQVDFLGVFTTQWVTRIVLFVVAGLITAATTWTSLTIAYRSRPVYVPTTASLQAMDRYREAFEPLRRVAMIGVPVVVGLFAGGAAQGQWSEVLLFLNRQPFGTVDPQFSMDVSFFVFTLPVLRFLTTFVMALIVVALVGAVVMHYLYGGIRIGLPGPGDRITRAARAQLGILAALVCLVLACSYWLDRYSMLLGSTGRFHGAGFTAINANLPAKTILAIIAVFIAALFAFTAVRGNWKLPALGVGLMVVSGIAIGWAYPALVQNFSVNPNAQAKESPYIQRNIDATLAAYGLEDVEITAYSAKTTAEAGALRGDAESTASIRLLDPTVVPPTFRQLQQNKQYYDFSDVLAVDRYEIEGTKRDTVIAVRDVKLSGVDASSQTWVNQHTVYTHGYGVVAAYGNTTNTDGRPAFYEGEIPPVGELGEYEPRVYFGQSSPEYSIVGAPEDTEPWELDYPDDAAPQGQKNNTYTGDGGPRVGNPLNKILYALKFGSTNILFSERVTGESQILYDRDPKTRVSKVAPYLTLDERVYPAVVDGRVVWVVDGYTTTNSYPYSRFQDLGEVTRDSLTASTLATGLRPIEPQTVNYMRNSVKAVVDAYDGSVTLYAWDTTDPVLQAWASVYGDTLTPMSEISGDLMSHLRYPESLFKMQRSLLATYHVQDATAFYSGQGFWRTPSDPTKSDNVQPPYYLTLKMPTQDDATFSLTSTYIPIGTGTNDRNILTGFLAVNSETGDTPGKVDPDYGKLRLLQLPQSATVSGPGQVQNLFNSDATVQETLRLLRDGGSEVINGNLLTLPMGGGLLYVQPVYVQSATGTRFPSLQKVLVSFGDKVGFADTLNEALDQVFSGDSGASAGDADRPTGTGEVPAVEDESPPIEPDTPATAGPDQTVETTPPAPDTTETTAPASTPPDQPETTPPAPPGGTLPEPPAGDLAGALARANQAMADSQAALSAGDWAAYGQAQDALAQALADATAAQEAGEP